MIAHDRESRTVARRPSGYMEQYLSLLAENGYHMIPIIPEQKAPGDYQLGKWTNRYAWDQYCTRANTPFELRSWPNWPGAGIGIACGKVVAIDIDIEDCPETAHKVQELAFEMFGETPAIRIGKHPKRLLLYKCSKPFNKFREGQIEILAHGSQFVAYGIHPETRKEYQWVDDSLADIPLSDLPEVTLEQVTEFAKERAPKLIPEHLRVSRLGSDLSSGIERYRADKNPRGTEEAITLAIDYVPNPDIHYDDWIRVLLALKASDIGPVAEDIFDEWSSRSSKYDYATTKKAWDSAKPRGDIGAGTIYYYAEKNGWIRPHDLITDGKEKDDLMSGDYPDGYQIAQDILNSKTQKRAPQENSNAVVSEVSKHIPSEIYQTSGAIKDMIEWIVRTSYKPQPFLALGATLAALGAAMGRRYATPTDLRSNLYVVGVANSASGKDHARRCVRSLFHAAEIEPMIGGDRIASGPAIATALKRSPALIFQLDEFGNMLDAIMNQRNAPKYLTEIMTNLTQLATSASSVFAGTEYAHTEDPKKKKKDDDEDEGVPAPTTIVNPHVCINATTTPGQFWSALKGGAIADGSIARYLIFSTDKNYPDSQFNPPEDPPESLVKLVKRMSAQAAVGLSCFSSYSVKPIPKVVPYGPGAEEMVYALDRRQTARLRQHETSSLAAVIGRTVEHTLKVALIAAVADDPDSPVMECRHLEWASMVVNHCIGTLLSAAEDEIADTGTEAAKKRLLNIIRDSGGGIGRRDLTRKSQNLKARERAELLQDLVDAGLIAQTSSSDPLKPGRKTETFQLCADAFDERN